MTFQELRLVAALQAANQAKDQGLAHEQVLRAEAEAARQHTARILARITDLFVALDHDRRLTYRNGAAEHLLQGPQRTRAELIGKVMEEICQEIVEIIPPAWQYPDITCVRIMLAGHTFASSNFQETPWKQASDIRVHGEGVGAVEVYYLAEKPTCDEGPFLKEERSLLATIAKLLGEIVGRKWVEGERDRYAAQLQALAAASLVMNSTGSLEEALRIATQKARDIIGAHLAMTSFTIDDNWAQATIAVSFSDTYATYRTYGARPSRSGIYQLVCQTNRPMRLTEAELEAHPAWQGFAREAGQHPPLRGWLAAPLIGRHGRSIGLIQLSDKYEGEFTADDEAILVQLAQMAAIASENAQLLAAEQQQRQQLQSLSQRLLEVQETERRFIARELHDEIGQLLTGLRLTLDMNLPPAPEATGGHLHDMRTLVDDLIARVRHLSHGLRPVLLDDLGLLPALLWHVERYTAQTAIHVVFEHTGLEGHRFGAAIETAAFRLVQEALTNVARHAQVTTVTVHVWSSADSFGVQIEDHGVGFDPQVVPTSSNGLVGMRGRALALGGFFSIASTPGSGTRVMAEWPLTSVAAASPGA